WDGGKGGEECDGAGPGRSLSAQVVGLHGMQLGVRPPRRATIETRHSPRCGRRGPRSEFHRCGATGNAGERIAHRSADTLYVPPSLDLDGRVERPAWRVGTRLAGVEHGHRGYSNGGREMHRTRVTRHDERAVAQERREVTDAKPRRHEHGTDEIPLQPACFPSLFR